MSADQWTYVDVAEHIQVAPSTVRRMKGRDLPEPDGHLGATPWWTPDTIRAWASSRPGRGRWGPRKVDA